MRLVKGESSEWINAKQFTKGKFSWQKGYAAFSYSRSQMNQVYQYILNQKKHHEKKSFMKEYIELLQEFGVEYDDRYIFKTPD